MAVLQNEEIGITSQGRPLQPLPAIIQVCQLYRSESLPMHYTNKFYIRFNPDCPEGPTVWHTSIGTRQHKCLQQVAIAIKASAEDIKALSLLGFASLNAASGAVVPILAAVKHLVKAGTPLTGVPVVSAPETDIPARSAVRTTLSELKLRL